ncbi:MAG: hypothetical protein NC343_05470 [Muribaculum sp.]|nr:hypothetical protein [Muribaculaceae bacterium]MCM1081180.1 hypothetical protein [Muribaculum sp.]
MARIFSILLLAMVIAAPNSYADNSRTSGNRNGGRGEQPAVVHNNHRQHTQHQAPQRQNLRPAPGKHDNKGVSNRPNHNYHNPGHNNHNSHGTFNRHGNINRPSHNTGHGVGHVQAPRPPHKPNVVAYRPPHRPVVAPPYRPHRPVPGPWHRPVKPHGWHPAPYAPLLSTMLGVAFGTALNVAINQLINNGYNVSGYNANTVFLTDVSQAGYLWPDATFYYSNGYLDRSQFYYSLPYNDYGRYNSLYRAFSNNYGYPVNVVNTPANMSATWFAPNQGYITLQYGSGSSWSLPGRFVTTLTVGI